MNLETAMSKLVDEMSKNARLEAALREIQAGAKSQGAFTGMSWSQVERICQTALGGDDFQKPK